jgi:hypothetical protein
MKRLKRTARAAFFLLAAANVLACSSPTASINFHPPAGWRASPTFFGFQAWRNGDNTQNLVLMRFPVRISAKDAFSRTDYSNLETASSKNVTICGHQPAVLFTGRGVSSRTHRERQVEIVWTSYPASTYMALYARDLDVRPNAQAEIAIRSLCLSS